MTVIDFSSLSSQKQWKELSPLRSLRLCGELLRRRIYGKFEEIMSPRELETLALEAEETASKAISWIHLEPSKHSSETVFALLEKMRAARATGQRINRARQGFEEDQQRLSTQLQA